MVVFFLSIIILVLLIITSVKGLQYKKVILERSFTDTLRGIACILILLHHAETNLYSELPNIFIVFIPLGAFGTAIFFYLSGYGNYYSLQKADKQIGGGDWLKKKLGRLVISYVLVIFLYSIVLCITKDPLISGENLLDYYISILKISIPPFTSWYIKIQLMVYVLHYIIYKVVNEKNIGILLLLLLCIYTVVMKISGFEDFWWTSALCYGIGNLIAERKKIVEKYFCKLTIMSGLMVSSVLLYICSLIYHKGTLLMCIIGVLALTSFFSMFDIKGILLIKAGNVSYELYLSQAVCIYLILEKQFVNINIRMGFYILVSIISAFIIEKATVYIEKILLIKNKNLIRN